MTSISFAEVAAEIRARIATFDADMRHDPSFPIPVPPGNHLNELLGMCIWASLQRDEGRPCQFRVAYYGTGSPSASEIRIDFPPQPLSVDLLRKLAPVCSLGEVNIACRMDGELVAFALLHGSPPAGLMPLEFETARPGAVSIEFGGSRIAQLEGGSIVPTGPAIFELDGPVRQVLAQLATEAKVEPRHLHRVLMDALRRVERAGHGGLLFLSNTEIRGTEPLRWRLTERARDLRDLHDKRLAAREATTEVSGQIEADREFKRASAKVAELYSALAATDGAVWLDGAFRPRAFGVFMHLDNSLQVAAHPKVYDCSQVDGSERSEKTFTTIGARHRAAVAFARHNPGCPSFAVSADGGFTACLARLADDGVLSWKFSERSMELRDIFDEQWAPSVRQRQ